MNAPIRTHRLDLIPMTPAFLRASLRGDLLAAEALIGLRLPATWPELTAVLELRLHQLETEPVLQPWLLRAVGLRGSREMVGHIGFHSGPAPAYLAPWCPGGIEFGVSIVDAHRRRGYAREAALGLMAWAREAHGVPAFVVTIGPTNEASQRLAASLGFVRVGAHVDETDGPEDVLVLGAAPDAGRDHASSS